MDKYTKFRKLYRRAKERAARDGMEFSLTLEQIRRKFLRQKSRCALTGQHIWFGASSKEQNTGYNTASIDRKDPTKGYTIRNIQWVDKRFNQFKANLNQKDFVYFCELVVSNKDLK